MDSYAQYMTAVTALQKQIMEDSGNIQPELLATTVISAGAAAPAEAVGTVYALHAIAEGATLAHALDKLGIDDASIAEAARALYRETIGEDDRAVPDPAAATGRAGPAARLPPQPELVPRLITPDTGCACPAALPRLALQQSARDPVSADFRGQGSTPAD